MNLPKLAVRRPITTAMLLVSVLLFGGIALDRLPLAFLPEVDVPFIAVQIPYPNANPAQVEREITKPLEEVLATLSGVERMRSRSGADGAFVSLRFNWGEDLDIVRMQVSEKVDQLEPDLPEGIGGGVVTAPLGTITWKAVDCYLWITHRLGSTIARVGCEPSRHSVLWGDKSEAFYRRISRVPGTHLRSHYEAPRSPALPVLFRS